MPDLNETLKIVAVICVLNAGCFTARPVSEAAQTTGKIILDTTQPYTPRVGDKLIIHIRYTLSPYNPQEQTITDSIAHFMMKYPEVVCEIGSHTDFRGSHEYNDTLSARWASALAEQVIIRGIDPQRIVPAGYGENVPRILEEDIYVSEWQSTLPRGAHLTEEYINQLKTRNEEEAAHYLNRRTELVIVGFVGDE
jgi:hypothetical protein